MSDVSLVPGERKVIAFVGATSGTTPVTPGTGVQIMCMTGAGETATANNVSVAATLMGDVQ